MASKRKRGRSWYARVFWYENGRKRETQIPLKTANEAVAMERLATVERHEIDIKKGFEFIFEWMSDSSVVQLKRFELGDAIDTWMKKRNKDGIRPNSVQINQYSLRYFRQALGDRFPLEGIKYQDIERYIDWLRKKGMKNTSINIHLRTVRTMLNYFSKIERLKKVPIIEQLSVARPDPHYITENEFKRILSLNSLDDFYKRVFLFYMETGMRLREIDIATLNDNWIDISSDSKSHLTRSIPVNNQIASIFNELKRWLEFGYGSKINDYGDHLSKRFKKSLMLIDASKEKHFHSLRHTFAVRSLLQEVPIYEVQKLLGHSSVTTTEVYSNMNLKRVAQDFPSLNRKSLVDNSLVDNTLSEYVHLKQYVKILA